MEKSLSWQVHKIGILILFTFSEKIKPMIAVTLYMYTNGIIYIRGGSQNCNFNFIYNWCEILLIANVFLVWNGMTETDKDGNLTWFIFSEKHIKREHRVTITKKKAIVWFSLATQDQLTHITGKGLTLCTNNKIPLGLYNVLASSGKADGERSEDCSGFCFTQSLSSGVTCVLVYMTCITTCN